MTTMQRSEFDIWGIELDDYKFACAIASLGICGGLLRNWPIPGDASSIANDLLKWAKPDEPLPIKFFIERPEKWSTFPYVPSASSLALAWELFQKTLPYNLRFKLEFDSITQHDLEGIKWLQQQLTIAVGNKGLPSFYQPLESFVKNINWLWPIRIGLFSDKDSNNLNHQLSSISSSYNWMIELTELIEISITEEESVDLLLVPGGIQSAYETIKNTTQSIHANSVGIIGGSEQKTEKDFELIQKILQLTQAGAVFVASPDNFGEWINNFIRELSHDVPFDIALFRAKISSQELLPMLWSTPEMLTCSSILKYCENLLDNPTLQIKLNNKIKISDSLGLALVLNPGTYSLEKFKNRIKEVGWLSEEHGAYLTMILKKYIAGILTKATQKKALGPYTLLRGGATKGPYLLEEILYREAMLMKKKKLNRFLQAEVRSENLEIAKFFYRNRVNNILIHIGPIEPGKIVLADSGQEMPFPDKELPYTKASGHMLTLVFFEPNLMEQPEVAGLFLPKSGRSEPCNFKLFISENTKRVEARVQVIYKNRILQSAILRGLVKDYYMDMPHNIGENEEITFTSHQVSTAHQDLDNRSRFNASFLLNHSGESSGIYKNSNNQSVYVWLDSAQINEYIKQFEKILNRSDWDKPEFDGLTTKGTTDLLRNLAWAGSSLYQSVIKKTNPVFTNESASLNGAPQKIQVVCANIATYMPFEYIYDFAAPDDTAEVCPKASEALLNGKCKNCSYINDDPPNIICPSGFWCMSKIIEWHAFTGELAESTLNAPFKMEIDNSKKQNPLKFMMNPLVGYSNKVTNAQPTSIDELQNSFNKIGISFPIIVNNWNEWKENIARFNPTLEVLLIHTEKKGPRIMIEIGDGMISTLNLKKYFTDKEFWPSIVLLFGCGTGTSVVQFQSVAAMVENHASIIVSTTSDVFGPIASKLAGYFIEQLGNLTDKQSFGDIMYFIRRKALANGVPMVLCLRTYGDADWILMK